MPQSLSAGRYFRVASALSFSTLLALVPLITVAFSTLSLFPVFEQWSGAIEAFLYRNFVPQLGDQIQIYLQEFSVNAGKLTIWGLVFLMISTLFLLATIEDTFNDIWQVEEGRSPVQRLLVYWAMLTLGPIIIAVSLSISSYLLSLSVINDQAVLIGIKSHLLSSLPFALELLGFIFFYSVVPFCDVQFRHAVVGGIVATVLFELAKWGFGLYILNFNSYQKIYGAIAILPVFLIWIYLSWLVVLIGAYVTAIFGNNRDENLV
ncbi:MAG: membrane protein [Saprospiraceae bacterium]|jgi:membrane protein